MMMMMYATTKVIRLYVHIYTLVLNKWDEIMEFPYSLFVNK